MQTTEHNISNPGDPMLHSMLLIPIKGALLAMPCHAINNSDVAAAK